MTKKFAIIRNMKCGSTSLSHFLRKNGMVVNRQGLLGNFLGNHATYNSIKEHLHIAFSEEQIKQITFVSSVRNPEERAVSAYAHLSDRKCKFSIDEWILRVWMRIPTDEEILNGLDIPNLKVFRLENLYQEVKEWAIEENLDHRRITKVNSRAGREKRRPRTIETELQKATKEAIRDKWSWTLDNFY